MIYIIKHKVDTKDLYTAELEMANKYGMIPMIMTSQWAQWCLKSPASPLFAQLLVQEQIKENIKAPSHWLLCGEFISDRWIPRTESQ